jgi:uncharacterized protein
MPEFLYVLRPTRLEMVTEGPTEREAASVAAHFAYLQDLTGQGVMRLVGRTQNNDERTIGIAVFRAADEAEARAIMQGDPAVRDGVMSAELFPFRIALESLSTSP